MENKESSLRLGIILLIITASAGLILGAIFNITKAPIARQTEKTNNDAMKEIITKADNFKKMDMKLNGNIVEVNEGKSSDKTIGYAIKVTSKGYGGLIELMVGMSPEGKVQGIKVLSQSETPGLGANSAEPAFYGQYKNKPIDKELEVVKVAPSNPNEIQAITGATITSKAVTSGVNEAIKFYKDSLKGGNN